MKVCYILETAETISILHWQISTSKPDKAGTFLATARGFTTTTIKTLRHPSRPKDFFTNKILCDHGPAASSVFRPTSKEGRRERTWERGCCTESQASFFMLLQSEDTPAKGRGTKNSSAYYGLLLKLSYGLLFDEIFWLQIFYSTFPFFKFLLLQKKIVHLIIMGWN